MCKEEGEEKEEGARGEGAGGKEGGLEEKRVGWRKGESEIEEHGRRGWNNGGTKKGCWRLREWRV